MTSFQESACEPGEEGPVTVSISRSVKPGREAEFEEWESGIIEAASSFPGYQGANVLRPHPETKNEYVVIYRFDCYQRSKAWEESELRREWLDKNLLM